MSKDAIQNSRVCTPRFLPRDKWAEADKRAYEINPSNRPRVSPAGSGKDRLVVDRRVYWGKQGVKLTVGFLDCDDPTLQKMILAHMNAWSEFANVQFVLSSTDPQVRIARLDSPPEMSGYWSYLGTDILSYGPEEPTMNLEGFTVDTPESEFRRVVRHETGHTLGFPHEHLREELINKLDPEKVIAYYKRTQHWTEDDVRAQLLTPLERASVLGSSAADVHSIMCYEVPGSLTHDGRRIVGGTDIDAIDKQVAKALYPKPRP